MGKIIGYLDHGIKRCIKYYRKRVFLDQINSIGAKALVKGRIDENVIAVGIPAKERGKRR